MSWFLYITGVVLAFMHVHEAKYIQNCKNKAEVVATIFMVFCWPVFVILSMIYALFILRGRNG